MDLLTLTVFTVVLLLIAVVLHRWTWAGTQRLLPSLGTCLALGFVGAGIGPAETLSVWALQGVVLGAFLTATLWLVGRYDRAPIPMIAAPSWGCTA